MPAITSAPHVGGAVASQQTSAVTAPTTVQRPAAPTSPSASPMAPSVRASTAAPTRPAEDFMVPLDSGFLGTPALKGHPRVRGWVDFAVRNYEYHKKMAVKLRVVRENGAVEEYLYRPKYKGALPDGRERWGVDSIELFHETGPNGKIDHVDLSYIVQADVDGDKQRDLCRSRHAYRLASLGDLEAPANNRGPLSATGANPDLSLCPVDTTRAGDAYDLQKDALPPIEVYFAPYDNPRRAVLAELDAVMRAKQADPDGRHYIHASVYDINDRALADKLIEAHRAGVEVQLLTSANHMRPDQDWETEWGRLQAAGISVIGAVREGVCASNHTKIVDIDGKVAMTGSLNWEQRAMDENCENLMIIRSPEIAMLYEEVFEAVGGGPAVDRPIDPSSKVRVFYSQQHDVPRVIATELRQAQKEITISMFTLRSLQFAENGAQKDILDELVAARRRGVKVTVVLEKNIADEGEYYGHITPNDLTDEWLEERGIEIVKIHTNYHNNKYAAMHHKFAVIDGETTLTGAYNWYGGSEVSDDDLIVVRDPAIAARYRGEVTNLRCHYDAAFDRAAAPQTKVSFEVVNGNTRPGDTVYILGDIPELGGWDAKKAIPLDGSSWPTWKASVDIPSGVHFSYKLLVRNARGTFWEPGSDREQTASAESATQTVAAAAR